MLKSNKKDFIYEYLSPTIKYLKDKKFIENLKMFLLTILGGNVIKNVIRVFRVHNWEYWEVSADIYFDCEYHSRMNMDNMVFMNRKCKWDRTEQYKLSGGIYGGLFETKPWLNGNIKHNSKIKMNTFNCKNCGINKEKLRKND
jgi:hypothetical protein